MAERGIIAYCDCETGIGKGIYIHSGAPSQLMPLLNEFYPTLNDAEQIVALGSLSNLGKTLESHPAIHTITGDPLNYLYAKFDHNEIYSYTFAYHRDRKGPWPENRPHEFIARDVLDVLTIDWESMYFAEHMYLWAHDEWFHCNLPLIRDTVRLMRLVGIRN